MARKRMFDAEIINQDTFLDLSIEAKAIYYLLGTFADDEGFISPKKILKVYGGTEEMLEELINSEFIIRFDSGIVVITDWKRNNYLDNSRVKETIYLEEKKQLSFDDKSRKYKRLTDVEQMLKQNSIEENRIDEIREEKISREENNTNTNTEENKHPSLIDTSVQDQIINYLNYKIKSEYKYTENNYKLINRWLNNNYNIMDFKIVIDKKYNEWYGTDMQKYLTINTLFGDKFEQYLEQPWNYSKEVKESMKDSVLNNIIEEQYDFDDDEPF